MSNHKKHRIRRFMVPPAIAALALLVLGSATAQAQTPTEPEGLHACYVPPTGLVYLIKGPGLRDN